MENEQSTCITFYSRKSGAEDHGRPLMLFREMVVEDMQTLQKGRMAVCDDSRNILRENFLKKQDDIVDHSFMVAAFPW